MKYFIVSDIHSFAKELKEGLKESGFQKTNKNHTLVVLGDLFDRGPESVEVYNFIMSIPKSRRIIIKGNHEELYLKLLNKNFPDSYDFSNGTVKTFCHIANFNPEVLDRHYWFKLELLEDAAPFTYNNNPYDYWQQIKEIVKSSPITKWIKSKEWKDYCIINNKYICVHSFIPTKLKDELIGTVFEYYPRYQLEDKCFTYNSNWQEANEHDWSESRWGNPFDSYDIGQFNPEIEKGNVLVHGHWHCSEGHRRYEHSMFDNYNIYYGGNIISIDACTVLSKQVNVLVIDEDNKCYDQRGLELKVLPKIETVTVKEIKDE